MAITKWLAFGEIATLHSPEMVALVLGKPDAIVIQIEEIFRLESESICGSQVDPNSTRQPTDSLVEPTDYLDDESSPAISNKVEVSKQPEVVKPTNRARTAFNSWIPEGAWVINGKLDPNFVLWLATDWQKAYGGDISKKKADVLRHFIAIAIAVRTKIMVK